MRKKIWASATLLFLLFGCETKQNKSLHNLSKEPQASIKVSFVILLTEEFYLEKKQWPENLEELNEYIANTRYLRNKDSKKISIIHGIKFSINSNGDCEVVFSEMDEIVLRENLKMRVVRMKTLIKKSKVLEKGNQEKRKKIIQKLIEFIYSGVIKGD